MEFGTPQFWIALLQIIGINIVLSGDNAVVIALAARSLPEKQRKQAVLIGSGAAVGMRIVLTVVAVELLRLPFLKLIGALLLLYIGIKLLVPEEDEHGHGGKKITGMAGAVRTILLADLVMSLDNVLAVAAAAKGSLLLLVVGLIISIPLVIFGSTLLMKFMDRWPIIVTIGAALLGWVAGEMAVTDPSTLPWIDANAHWLHYVLPALGALSVVAVGAWLARRVTARMDVQPVIDLALPADQVHAAPQPQAPGDALPMLYVVDDRSVSAHAIERLLAQLALYRRPVSLHLVNVQHPAHADVADFVDQDALAEYHHEQGLQELKTAREKLDAAGTPYVIHIGVGDPAHVIGNYARDTTAEHLFVSVESALAAAMVRHGARLANLPVTLLPA